MNHRLIKTIFSALTILSINAKAQSSKGDFTIKGSVQGHTVPYIIMNRYTTTDVIVDTVPVANNQFIFKGITNEPTWTNVIIPDSAVNQSAAYNDFSFFTEKGNYTADIHSDTLSNSLVVGTPTNNLRNEYHRINHDVLFAINQLTYQYINIESNNKEADMINDTLIQLEAKIAALEEKKFESDAQFIAQNNTSFFSLTLLQNDVKNDLPVETALPLFNALVLDLQMSSVGKELKESLTKAKQFSIGNSVVNIKAKDAKNQTVDLFATIKSHKYTLIDFWASWCVPCQQEFPFLKQAFANYQNKGFNIYAIAQNSFSIDAWLDALKRLNLPWTNVVDDEHIPTYYKAITAIPFNLLVDNTGKILGRNLRGAKLDKMLQQLLP